MPKSSGLEASGMAVRAVPVAAFESGNGPISGWLVKNTALGRTEKDVAQYLLNQKIQEMRLGYYSEPRPEGDLGFDRLALTSPYLSDMIAGISDRLFRWPNIFSSAKPPRPFHWQPFSP